MDNTHELDLVIGDLEQELPATGAEGAAGTCVRVYCDF
jgi:hypothetical protein